MFRTANRTALSNRRNNRERSRWGRTRLWLHSLEERTTPALLTVTSALDDGVGDTLRNVMATADSNGQDDTIQFAGGITNIALALGELTLSNEAFNTTFNGTGVTIDGVSASRIFNFNVLGGDPTITINGLKLTNGNATATGGGAILMHNDPLVIVNATFQNNKATGFGGAIGTTTSVPATLDVSGSTFTGNTATTTGGAINGTSTITLNINNSSFTSNKSTSTGGAIQMSTGGTATITLSTFTSNTASANGGALSTAGATTMTVNTSTFTGNQGTNGGVIRFNSTSPSQLNFDTCTMTGNIATARGGAIYSVATATVSIVASTIANNTATGNGGGLALTVATTTITNSTISGNESKGTSGGGGFYSTTGVVTFNNTTVAFNKATNAAGLGGGIRKTSATGTLTLNSTIVGKNTCTGAGGVDIHATAAIVIAGGQNLVGNTAAGNFTLSGTNQTGDPLLAALGNFGGPTLTHALLPGSPAVDNGNNLLGLSFDQRGPGFPRETLPADPADVGATEGILAIPAGSATLPNVPPINAKYTAIVVYTDNIGINTTKLDSGDVRLTGPGYGAPEVPTNVKVTGMNGDKMVTVEYEFNPPGGSWDGPDNGTYSLDLQANEVFDTDANSAFPGSLGTFKVAIGQLLNVNQIGDVDDLDPNNGMTTLREAINRSNASLGAPDTITFDASINTMPILVANGELTVADSFTMQGNGIANTIISGNLTNRIFNLAHTGATSTVDGITFRDGLSTGVGGAIVMNSSNLTVSNSFFTNNTCGATSLSGAISLGAATLKVFDSTFTGNFGGTGATTGGAAIGTGTGIIEVTRCVIDGNTSGGQGTAIQVNGAGSATIIDSTISNNTNNSAAGSAIHTSTGTITIINSTVSGNTSPDVASAGGAVRVTGAGKLIVQNSTITNNSAGAGGGGIAVTVGTATVTISSSIVAQNVNATHPDFFSTVTTPTSVSIDNSVIGAWTDLDIKLNANNSRIGTDVANQVDAKLDTLQLVGGTTKVHPLLAGSPAFNIGNANSLSFDQRGTGFNRTDGRTDAGSFEGASSLPTASATLANVPPINAKYVATVVYEDETGIDTNSIGVADVRLTGPGYAMPEAPVSAKVVAGMNGDKSVTVEYEFNPAGGGWDGNDNGLYFLTMVAGEVADVSANTVAPGGIDNFYVAVPANYVVNQTGDIDDLDPNNGMMTLREALRLSNATVGVADTISFDASINTMPIVLATSLAPTDSVIINGNGATNTIIDGNNAVRIINLATLAGLAITINGVTLTNGNISGNGATIDMGGDSTLTINDCVISNGVSTATAGGIRSGATAGGSLTIRRTTFMNNTTTNAGAAIYVRSNLLVEDCLFVNNMVTGASIGGGAITITNSGGARSNVIRNSTFNGNSANRGGAFSLEQSQGTIIIQNCTIAGNTATAADGGGGIAVGSGTGNYLVESTIISGNFATASANTDMFSLNTVTANNSLIGVTTGVTTFVPDATTTMLLGQDPMLAALASNGGPTQTMAITKLSPAWNKGSNPASLTSDQRGPLYARSSFGAVDIGAFEVQAPPQVANVIVDDGTGQRSLVRSLTVQFDNSFVLTPGAFTLTRYANGLAGTIGLVATPMGNNVVLTFDNTGTIALDPGGSLPDGTYELTIVANNVTGTAGTLDGNKNGISDGSPVDNASSKMHRLFGDANGDGSVTASDFNAFRLDYGVMGASIFDFDASGSVNASDFNAFRLRYGSTNFQP